MQDAVRLYSPKHLGVIKTLVAEEARGLARPWRAVVQRLLLIALLAATGTLCSAAPKKPSVHQQIAGYAAAIATNLLAQDIKDEHGLLLLRFARTLQPENDAVLLAAGMLKRGKNPQPLETKVTAEKLYAVIASQAKNLRLKEWPKNTKAGQLALLYYRMAERFQPPDEEIMLALMKLRVRGVRGDLEQALAQTSDLKDIFGKPEKPERLPKHDLAEVDRDIAKYAAIWATNRLAADPNDGKGRLLLRLAGCLAPDNRTALLTAALLEREKTPAILPSDATEEKLVDVIISRAGKLLAAGAAKYKRAGQLSLLYFKVAERFRPEEQKVILGLMKLETRGIGSGLDELLAAGPSLAALAPPPKPPVKVQLVMGRPWTVAEPEIELLPIKAGRFTMGSSALSGAASHRVRLTKAFWLGKYEVTRAQYERIMGNNPNKVKGANLPVSRTSWLMATKFCVQLTERERKAARLPKGYEYRLPTEAEWEYACRAGKRTAFSFGDKPEKVGDYAWYKSNSSNMAHFVGQKKPNAWGLYDMHGNVWELCQDWFGEYPAGVATDPLGPGEGSHRVSRGGGWESAARSCRAAARGRDDPARTASDLGFRVALAPAITTK